jgi:hypothetical protein
VPITKHLSVYFQERDVQWRRRQALQDVTQLHHWHEHGRHNIEIFMAERRP